MMLTDLIPEPDTSSVISRTSWKCDGLVTLSLCTKRARKGCSLEGGGECVVGDLLMAKAALPFAVISLYRGGKLDMLRRQEAMLKNGKH